MDDFDELVEILNIPPNRRSKCQLQLIFDRLRSVDSLNSVRDSELKRACERAKFRYVDGHTILYKKGDHVDEWFVLLVGSVFINGSMFFPVTSVGLGNLGEKRSNQCFVLEPSQLIVIDLKYPVRREKLMEAPDSPEKTLMNTTSEYFSSSHDSHSANSMGKAGQFISGTSNRSSKSSLSSSSP